MVILEKGIPGRGNSKCKGSEAQDQQHTGQCGWNRRNDGKSDREGREARETMGPDLRTLKAVIRTFYSE